MSKDTRVALLVGLAFIVLFGLILGQRSLNLLSASRHEVTPTSAPALSSPPTPCPRTGPEVSTVVLNEKDERPALAPPLLGRPVAPAPPSGGPTVAGGPPPAGPGLIPAPGPMQLPGPGLGGLADIRGGTPGPRSAGRTYTVQAGDSLAKIAKRLYGAGHEIEYRRIQQANKDKIADATKMKPGMVLVIPPLEPVAPAAGPTPGLTAVAGGLTPTGGPTPTTGPAPTGVGVPAGGPPPLPRALEGLVVRPGDTAVPSPLPIRPDGSGTGVAAGGDATERTGACPKTYTVKPGDNLASIARKTLGEATRANMKKIVNANRGKLEDPDCLQVGVTLKIPGGAA